MFRDHYYLVPNAGAQNMRAMQVKLLFAFDILIIVGATRFTEFDISLAWEALGNRVTSFSLSTSSNEITGLLQVPCMFVRSKADIDIENRADREDKKPADVKQEV